MKIGLTAYDMPASEFVELARAADEAGFESLWLGEHVVLPVGFATPHPTAAQSEDQHHHTGPIVDPETELVDPLVQLGAAAVVTSRLQLATGIYVLPLRHPLTTARSVCTVQELAKGRFVFGVGFGWLEEEFAALDVPFRQRASRFEETIAVLRAAWKGGPLEHAGQHFSISGVQVTKRQTDVPIILGGNSDKALRRAVRLGDGWFSSGTPSLKEAQRLRDDLHRLREEDGSGRAFEMTFRIGGCDPAVVRRYEEAGFDNVLIWADQLWPAAASLAEQRDSLFEAAALLGLR